MGKRAKPTKNRSRNGRSWRSNVGWRYFPAPGKHLACFAMLAVWTLACACSSGHRTQEPSIEFTKIPPAAQGGRERVDSIAGRGSGARARQRVVVYGKSAPWWVQPWPDQALLEIQADGTWSTPTHLGYEYAALLVDPDYRPPPTLDLPPASGGSVSGVRIAKGVGTLP